MGIFENYATVLSILVIIIFGLWGPLFILYYSYKNQRNRENFILRKFGDLNIGLDDKINFGLDKKTNIRNMNNNERYIAKIMEEIPYLISREVSSSLTGQINKLIKERIHEQSLQLESKIEKYKTHGNSNFQSNKQLIREIAHSLNTPLSQIEASAEILFSTTSDVDKNHKTIGAITSSVNLCKAFIAAYRQMILVTSYRGGWEPKSINESLRSACEIYSESVNANLQIVVDMPEEISGYSNNYIVAILLPLIENAAEAAIQNTKLSVVLKHEDGNIIITVTNFTHNVPLSKDIFISEFTTKNGHQGLGLSTVTTLLAHMEGASIDYKEQGEEVIFELKLRGANK